VPPARVASSRLASPLPGGAGAGVRHGPRPSAPRAAGRAAEARQGRGQLALPSTPQGAPAAGGRGSLAAVVLLGAAGVGWSEENGDGVCRPVPAPHRA